MPPRVAYASIVVRCVDRRSQDALQTLQRAPPLLACLARQCLVAMVAEARDTRRDRLDMGEGNAVDMIINSYLFFPYFYHCYKDNKEDFMITPLRPFNRIFIPHSPSKQLVSRLFIANEPPTYFLNVFTMDLQLSKVGT